MRPVFFPLKGSLPDSAHVYAPGETEMKAECLSSCYEAERRRGFRSAWREGSLLLKEPFVAIISLGLPCVQSLWKVTLIPARHAGIFTYLLNQQVRTGMILSNQEKAWLISITAKQSGYLNSSLNYIRIQQHCFFFLTIWDKHARRPQTLFNHMDTYCMLRVNDSRHRKHNHIPK